LLLLQSSSVRGPLPQQSEAGPILSQTPQSTGFSRSCWPVFAGCRSPSARPAAETMAGTVP